MSGTTDRYRLWLTHPFFDEATRAELAGLAANGQEIEDRFYRHLGFGTGGLRGVIGAGTNRINLYTIRQAAHGLGVYVQSLGPSACARGVVIAHDPRRLSPEFAREAALTLNAAGVAAYLWEGLRPTPLLSFAVRELGAAAGIVITASHNPKEYNGFKVYGEDGGQVPPERAAVIEKAIREADLLAIRPMTEPEARAGGLLRTVASVVDRAYMDRLLALVQTAPAERSACRILYTPLHGSGNRPIRQVLGEAGYQVDVVQAQAEPDAEFSTVASPNPEEPAVFRLALAQAGEGERPDVIMATDPDADRLGVLALDRSGEYRLLTGNQIGALLVDYLLAGKAAQGSLPSNGAVIKTIATSNMIRPLCAAYGVALMDTHTGFKFIGDKIREFEETGSHTFLLGYEESYGYLGATFVRDKDAVMAALLVAEATAYHKARGRTLYDALEAIWARCGHFVEGLHNVTLPGKEGQAQIGRLMAGLRGSVPGSFGGVGVAYVDDYAAGTSLDVGTGVVTPLALGRADVLHYRFADGGFVMVRPSGTEPKLKLYFSVTGGSQAEAGARLEAVRGDVLGLVGGFL